MKQHLPASAQKLILEAVEKVYERLKTKFLGYTGGKKLVFSPFLSLAGLYVAASKQEGMTPRPEGVRSVTSVAETYLDSHKEKTKAKVLSEVQATMAEAQKAQVDTDLETVLEGKLSEIWGSAKKDVQRVLETETTRTRNVAIYDAIDRVGGMLRVDDPTVFFVVVRDGQRCGECTRLHLLDDGITPRVWKMSELGAGYHKKGDDNPKIGGLHPHCFAGDVRIFTDAGPITIKELYDTQIAKSVVVDGRVKQRRVGNNQFGSFIEGESWYHRHSSGSVLRPISDLGIYPTGIQECLKIELETGHSITVSVGHEQWVDDGQSGYKVRADELQVGDKLPLLSGVGAWGPVHKPEIAELAGNLLGDGSLSGTTAVWHFFGTDIPYGEKLFEYTQKLGCDLTWKVKEPNQKYRVQNVTFGSSRLARIMAENGVSKKPRRVPNFIWHSDKETTSSFLRGLFAADGHVEYKAIVLAQNDFEFLKQIQILLSNFGIISRIYEHGNGGEKPIIYANGQKFDTLRKACWRLHIGGEAQIAVFAKDVGMGVPAKQTKLLAQLGGENRSHWRTARIKSIRSVGPVQTYCLTEPQTNTVTANGIVTGQCRCVLTHLMKGYGFNESGRVTYISPDHDEFEKQRG
jgi:intein/homing endonuclease